MSKLTEEEERYGCNLEDYNYMLESRVKSWDDYVNDCKIEYEARMAFKAL